MCQNAELEQMHQRLETLRIYIKLAVDVERHRLANIRITIQRIWCLSQKLWLTIPMGLVKSQLFLGFAKLNLGIWSLRRVSWSKR